MLQNTPNRWLTGGRPHSHATLRLFAFAYAGGGASVFRQWNKILPSKIDTNAVQLPGREARFNEPRLTDFTAAVDAIVAALRPSLNQPFAFFGHSLGGSLAFEVTRQLRRLGAPLPIHLFISGATPVRLRDNSEQHSKKSDAEFIQAVKKYGGLPDEIINNTELIDLFLPILRADFTLFESYQQVEEPPLNCPITVFGGVDDVEAPQSKLTAWSTYTTQAFRLKMFPGGHFFLNTAQAALLEEITRDLAWF